MNKLVFIFLMFIFPFAETNGQIMDIGGDVLGDSNSIQSEQLEFSHSAGFYREPFELQIFSQNGDRIYYTLDGSLPDENSNEYTSALFIEDRTLQSNCFSEIRTSPEQDLMNYKAWEPPEEPIDKVTVLRCASFSKGKRTSPIYTKTYFVAPNIYEKYSMPVISLVTNPNNLFNQESGIYVPGTNFRINNPQWSGNYFNHDINWEKPIHIEYFQMNGQMVFSQNAGVRIHGGGTRAAAQKSLRLYAREEYGNKYFHCKLLPNRKLNKYKRFILRTTMGGWTGQTIIKDAVGQSIARNLDLDYQDFRPVVVFINGEYWGIHTIRDRIDERYIEYLHNIDKDSVIFYRNDNSDFRKIIRYISTHDLAEQEYYEYVKNRIDISNYIDYNIIEQFLKNYDWPSGNFKIWRSTMPNSKWRWVLFDLDAGFGGPRDYNMLEHTTLNDSSVVWPNNPKSTFLFRKLLQNRDFRVRFINRYAELLNTELRAGRTIEILNRIEAMYEPEVRSHIDRWHYPESFKRWKSGIENSLRLFLAERPCYVAENISEFFNLNDFGFACDTTIAPTGLDIDEDLLIAPNPSKGLFFLYNKFDYILDAEITISNTNGIIVFKEENVCIPPGYIKSFALGQLPDNLYLLRIIGENIMKQRKIIILH